MYTCMFRFLLMSELWHCLILLGVLEVLWFYVTLIIFVDNNNNNNNNNNWQNLRTMKRVVTTLSVCCVKRTCPQRLLGKWLCQLINWIGGNIICKRMKKVNNFFRGFRGGGALAPSALSCVRPWSLRAKRDRESAISLQCGHFDPKFQVEGVAPPPIIFAR